MAIMMQMTVFIILLAMPLTKGGIVTVEEHIPKEGKSHSLKCRSENKSRFSKLMFENGGIQIVYCDKEKCNLNPTYTGQYNFSYNVANNEVILTILKVDRRDNGKKFVCKDGTKSSCKILHIAESEQRYEKTENGALEGTSACSPVDRKVSMKWIKIDVVSNEEEEFQPKLLYKNVSNCSDECEGNNQKYTEAIAISESGKGKKYFLKMVVLYGAERIESTPTSVDYIVDEQDSNVVITDEGIPCECGTNVTLTCKLKEFKFAVEWSNGNDSRPISKCIKNQFCKLNPDYVGRYLFTHDEALCVFNLTIFKLNKNDDGRKLTCSDGTNSDYRILRVRDYEPQLIESTKDGTITAESGCVTKETNVSFKWIMIDALSRKEVEFKPSVRKNSQTFCSNDSECGNNQQIKQRETISGRPGIRKYRLKVAAVYGDDEIIESLGTDVQISIDDQDTHRSKVDGNLPALGLKAVVLSIATCTIVAIVAFALCIIYRRKCNAGLHCIRASIRSTDGKNTKNTASTCAFSTEKEITQECDECLNKREYSTTPQAFSRFKKDSTIDGHKENQDQVLIKKRKKRNKK